MLLRFPILLVFLPVAGVSQSISSSNSFTGSVWGLYSCYGGCAISITYSSTGTIILSSRSVTASSVYESLDTGIPVSRFSSCEVEGLVVKRYQLADSSFAETSEAYSGNCAHTQYQGYWPSIGSSEFGGYPDCRGIMSVNTSCNFSLFIKNVDCQGADSSNAFLCPYTPNCSYAQSGADSLLAQARAQCEALGDSTVGRELVGSIDTLTNSNGVTQYCINTTCLNKYTGECPADSSGRGGNMLLKFSLSPQAVEEPETCGEPPAEAPRQRNVRYYNAKGQVVGSSGGGLPKARMPVYAAREILRGTTAGRLIEENYGDESSLRAGPVLIRQYGSASSCGVLGKDYGIVNKSGNPPYIAGITCPNVMPRATFGDSLPPVDTSVVQCGGGKMCRFNGSVATIYPFPVDTVKIHMIDTNFKIKGGIRFEQDQLDSIWLHELGHKKDMEKCIIPKLQPRKVMFEGCHCKKQLDSIMNHEFISYDSLFKYADSLYHYRYGHSGYPNPEEEYECLH